MCGSHVNHMAAAAAVGKLTLAVCRPERTASTATPLTVLTVGDVTTHLVLGDNQVLCYGLLFLVVRHLGSEVSVARAK